MGIDNGFADGQAHPYPSGGIGASAFAGFIACKQIGKIFIGNPPPPVQHLKSGPRSFPVQADLNMRIFWRVFYGIGKEEYNE